MIVGWRTVMNRSCGVRTMRSRIATRHPPDIAEGESDSERGGRDRLPLGEGVSHRYPAWEMYRLHDAGLGIRAAQREEHVIE